MPLALSHARPVPLWRHLMCMLYDAFLLLACFFGVAFVFSIFSHGAAIRAGILLYLLRATLLLVWLGFVVYFWSAQGQTLGMRAWRVIICDDSGHLISKKRAMLRFFYAILCCLPAGLGLWWQLWDDDQRTLYDRLAKTRLYTLPANPYS